MIIKKLIDKYNSDDIEYAIDIINELTYEMILDVVLKKHKSPKRKYKNLIEKLKRKYKNEALNQLALGCIIKK